MAHIFISYSRADIQFIHDLVPLLTEVYPDDTLFYDAQIAGGEDWWQRILSEIAKCDLFIYLLSNESLESPYCQAEFREALRLQKSCLPIIVRPKTDVSKAPKAPEDLEAAIRKRNWIDFSAGFQDHRANAKLYASINRRLSQVSTSSSIPLSPEPVPEPPVPDTRVRQPRRSVTWIAALVAIGLIVVLLLTVVSPLFLQRPTSTAVAQQPTAPLTFTLTPAAPATLRVTSIPSPTPTVPTPTEAPTLDVVYIVQTLDAQGTAAARLTNIAATTAFVRGRTQTATLWTQTTTPTRTPSPNITASIDAFRTQRAASMTAQYAINLTATATRWTATPTPTNTPSVTPTLTDDQRARIPVTLNADWKPVIRDFDGVKMALVPVGCFTIGSAGSIYPDERPISKICFDAPFWIDQTEVTNAQFVGFNGQAGRPSAWTDANRPRERITWFEAHDFCAKRKARLPTEPEWEYVARGPDNLEYPWGNTFVADNVVYYENSNAQSADVGSKPRGVSWVGALDMGGNVWEWVSTIYKPYPYNPHDGRESSSDIASARGLRGGSWSDVDIIVRSAYRLKLIPSLQYNNYGFRCARDF
jgi:formylglycine-generating enzyme required for sulfatase activity